MRVAAAAAAAAALFLAGPAEAIRAGGGAAASRAAAGRQAAESQFSAAALWPFAALPFAHLAKEQSFALEVAEKAVKNDVHNLATGIHLRNKLNVGLPPDHALTRAIPKGWYGTPFGDAFVLTTDLQVCLQCVGEQVSMVLTAYLVFDKGMRLLKWAADDLAAKEHVLLAGQSDAAVLENVGRLLEEAPISAAAEGCEEAEQAKANVVGSLRRGAADLRRANDAMVAQVKEHSDEAENAKALEFARSATAIAERDEQEEEAVLAEALGGVRQLELELESTAARRAEGRREDPEPSEVYEPFGQRQSRWGWRGEEEPQEWQPATALMMSPQGAEADLAEPPKAGFPRMVRNFARGLFSKYETNMAVANGVTLTRGALGIADGERQVSYVCTVAPKIPWCGRLLDQPAAYIGDVVNGHLATKMLRNYAKELSHDAHAASSHLAAKMLGSYAQELSHALAAVDPIRHLQATSSLLTLVLIAQKYVPVLLNPKAPHMPQEEQVEPLTAVSADELGDMRKVVEALGAA